MANRLSVYTGRGPEPVADRQSWSLTAVASRLVDEGIDRVYSSPLRRAIMTATPTARRLGVSVDVSDAFNELEMGPWTGQAEEDLRRANPADVEMWKTEPHLLRVPGRETLEEVQTRAVRGLAELAALGLSTVAVFTHDSVIRVVLAHALGASVSIYRRIIIAHCGLSSINFSGKGCWVELVNETQHLRGAASVA
jgi:probable phosphoglycerate mutase